MVRKLRWGILGSANIATGKVIPAIQKGEFCEVTAIASRDLHKARGAAKTLGIIKAYGSYEELLADPNIDAVYNPLPNHLHLKWTKKAAESGKHVLCEKPIGINCDEVQTLLEVRDREGVKIQEAFMVRTHPTWLAVRYIIDSGQIGAVKNVSGHFSYFNNDPENIRNKLKMGGGALLDIGCYCINFARFVFRAEPKRVSGLVNRDSTTRVDTLTTALLDFPGGHASFSCSTQMVPYQKMQVFGLKGRIEVEIPFNIPRNVPTRIFIDNGAELGAGRSEVIEYQTADQYTIQGDLFSKAILENSEQPIPLEDSYNNMAVVDSVFRSAESGNWEVPNAI